MWRRQSVLYSPERVERLRAFSDLLIEAAVLRRERLDLVNRLQPLVMHPHLLQKIKEVIREAEIIYPDQTIGVTLMDELANTQIDPDHISVKTAIPWKDTFCKYVVASAKPFEVTDSLNDLVVCQSPYADGVRSYNGVPLIVKSYAVGVICLFDDNPREAWISPDKKRLEEWASTIVNVLETELSQQ